jgi:polyisoprenoid-binding protein YceI
MKKFLLISLVVATAGIFVSAFTTVDKKSTDPKPKSATDAKKVTTRWNIDKAHSFLRFTVTHMVVSEAEGTFKNWNGTFEHTKEDFSDAKIAFTVDVNSISTDNENRDKHLKSDDFFNAEKYPEIKFVSTSMVPAGDKKYKLNGNLTIRDVTKPVVFDVIYGGILKTARGNKSGFKATTTINRFDYNLKWDRATEAGSLVVSKEVEIAVKLELDEAK